MSGRHTHVDWARLLEVPHRDVEVWSDIALVPPQIDQCEAVLVMLCQREVNSLLVGLSRRTDVDGVVVLREWQRLQLEVTTKYGVDRAINT